MPRSREYVLHLDEGDNIRIERSKYWGGTTCAFSVFKIIINNGEDTITLYTKSNEYPNFPTYNSSNEESGL